MRTVFKWIGIACLTLVGLFVLGALVNFVMGWLTKPAEVFGVQNVENQWQFAYDMEEDLLASARQYCSAVGALDSAQGDYERQQRQTQKTAIEQNYARIASDYNGRMRDAFRAKLVKPPDVREKAFTLQEAIEYLEFTEDFTCGE